MWVGSSSSLSGLSTVDFFPVFPRVFSPAGVMGFDFTGLVVWLFLAPRSLNPPSRSTLFARFFTFWRLCDASWGPPLFPHSWQRFLASCLAALLFASLPLVSRPWTVLSWSHLLSLSSVSDCLVVVPRQLVGLGGWSPASPNCPPSRVRKQRFFRFSASLSLRVFVVRSPYRVESVSVLNRTDGSYYTFLVLVGAFAMRSPLRVEFFSDLDGNEDSSSIFPRVWCQAFSMGSPVSGRVAFFCALDRNESFFRPSILRCFAMGSPYGSSVVFLPLDRNKVFFG